MSKQKFVTKWSSSIIGRCDLVFCRNIKILSPGWVLTKRMCFVTHFPSLWYVAWKILVIWWTISERNWHPSMASWMTLLTFLHWMINQNSSPFRPTLVKCSRYNFCSLLCFKNTNLVFFISQFLFCSMSIITSPSWRSVHTMPFFCIFFAIWRKCKGWVLYPFSTFDTTSHRMLQFDANTDAIA